MLASVALYGFVFVLVKYPCGKQWSQVYLHRSLLDDLNDTDDFFANHTHPDNTSHPGPHASDDSDVRIVGGQLQQQGGSPWQVGRVITC